MVGFLRGELEKTILLPLILAWSSEPGKPHPGGDDDPAMTEHRECPCAGGARLTSSKLGGTTMLQYSEQPSRKSRPVLASLLTAAALSAGCASVSDSDFRTVVSIQDDKWLINGRVVHAGSPAEGLLMNVRRRK
jgi:hypothetical protein